MATTLRVTVWGENRHEKTHKAVRDIYPKGMHAAIAGGIEEHLGRAARVRTVTLDDPDQGVSDKVLAETDVLTWWGHAAHHEVEEKTVDRVQKAVLEGMGLVVLHSGHYSKIFRRLMGTGCGLRWREAAELERIWCVNPGHPIADGLPDYFELPHEEMYGELFDVPPPDETVFISWFEGGEVFRSGLCWTRGKGKVFYFRPGHEVFPTYHDKNVKKVIANGVTWAARRVGAPYALGGPNIGTPLSPIRSTHVVDDSLHKH